MARTPNVKILEWGTPPEPEPTGWDAVAAELRRKPGQWANVGAMSASTARKIAAERLTPDAGYELRPVAGKDGQLAVWIRWMEPTAVIETRDPEPTVETRDDVAAVRELTRTVHAGDAEPKRATVKRGNIL